MTNEVEKPMQSEALKFCLEEYKVLSSDIQSRVTLQHGLLNFQFLFIGAFVALLATMLRDGSVSKYQNQLEFIALIAPIIFSMFVLWRPRFSWTRK
ncbi:MAG: hypothetical protein ED859_18735 [Desulfuromonadales bacterium]|nr:MAG: hypothetical protein ED859_18735 [Desulfuromonadales bacterium]